ncbi:MAG: hypothetical protein QGH76_00255 [Phycisphaerales bacterium]|jgi:hypothetical protein|nr:hypothetical protein [Phycisphaerales bacterium]
MFRKRLILGLIAATCMGGCASGPGDVSSSSLEVRSLGLTRVVLRVPSTTTCCMATNLNSGDLWLTDIPLEDLYAGTVDTGQVMHLELLWLPRAGNTPIDATATNVAIRHVVFANGEVGLYAGGGFGWPHGSPDTALRLSMEQATIALKASTPGFEDLLSPATMSGSIGGTADPELAARISAAVDKLVSKAIESPTIVRR